MPTRLQISSGLGAADAMDIGQRDRHALLVRDVDAGNSRHLRISFRIGHRKGAGPHSRANRRIIRIAGASTSTGPDATPAISARESPLRSGASPRRCRPCRRPCDRMPLGAVIRQDRRGLLAIGLEAASSPPPAGRRARCTKSVGAADVADAVDASGGLIALVIAGAALRAAEAAGEAVDQRRLVDLHQDHVIELAGRARASIASSASACGTVRGNPSRMKPFLALGRGDARCDQSR